MFYVAERVDANNSKAKRTDDRATRESKICDAIQAFMKFGKHGGIRLAHSNSCQGMDKECQRNAISFARRIDLFRGTKGTAKPALR